MSLFKFVTNPVEPFQPWRINCQAGYLIRDGHPLPLSEDEELSGYFQYLIAISSLIKVEEVVIEPTVSNTAIPETILEAHIEENNTVDDIVKVEDPAKDAPSKGKKG